MKKMKQILALMLAVLMLVPALAACKQNTDETENEATITATPVKYSRSGKYTAAVSSENVDLSGITVENVEVRYMFSATLSDTAEGASPDFVFFFFRLCIGLKAALVRADPC